MQFCQEEVAAQLAVAAAAKEALSTECGVWVAGSLQAAVCLTAQIVLARALGFCFVTWSVAAAVPCPVERSSFWCREEVLERQELPEPSTHMLPLRFTV